MAELRGVLPRGVAAFAGRSLPDGSIWGRTLRQYGLEAPQMLTDMLCIGFPAAAAEAGGEGPARRSAARI